MTAFAPSRRLLLAASAATLALPAGLAGPARAQAIGRDDRMIVPGTRVGAVVKGSTWESLVAIYGAENMIRADAGDDIPEEGVPKRGAQIYPEKPDMIEVEFMEHDKPVVSVAISRENSPWRTASGIRIGTTMAELEKLNGGPFRLNGFGWDGGGIVGPARKLPKHLEIRLSPRQWDRVTKRERDRVTGDITIFSNNPVLKKIDVAVNILRVTFAE